MFRMYIFFSQLVKSTVNSRGVKTNLRTHPPGRPDTGDGSTAGRRLQNLRPAGRLTGLNMKTKKKKPIQPYYTGKIRRFSSIGAFRRWF